jgi:hypothetical protein
MDRSMWYARVACMQDHAIEDTIEDSLRGQTKHATEDTTKLDARAPVLAVYGCPGTRTSRYKY